MTNWTERDERHWWRHIGFLMGVVAGRGWGLLPAWWMWWLVAITALAVVAGAITRGSERSAA